MAVYTSRLCETRDDDDRSQEARDFIEAVSKVCKEHGFAIGHKDSHGGFQVYKFDVPEQLQANLGWFENAAEIVWLYEHGPPAPPEPDPFSGLIEDPFL